MNDNAHTPGTMTTRYVVGREVITVTTTVTTQPATDEDLVIADMHPEFVVPLGGKVLTQHGDD